jgi:asparagine N-glycosylation enzyme membrane subunit Stt3
LVIGDLQPTIESHLDRMNERLRPIRTWIGLHGLTLLVTLIALAVTAASITYGPRAVGGADEYGYVSQADLWLDGKLTIDQSFVRQTPWHYAEWHFAPLGYRPHPLDRGLLVPAYSPGLPILLALAKAIGGQDALFFVVPLSAGLLILGTYRLGVRLGARRAGAIAAWFVATSPVVLFMSTSTMSDVPVAAAWTAAGHRPPRRDSCRRSRSSFVRIWRRSPACSPCTTSSCSATFASAAALSSGS